MTFCATLGPSFQVANDESTSGPHRADYGMGAAPHTAAWAAGLAFAMRQAHEPGVDGAPLNGEFGGR